MIVMMVFNKKGDFLSDDLNWLLVKRKKEGKLHKPMTKMFAFLNIHY